MKCKRIFDTYPLFLFVLLKIVLKFGSVRFSSQKIFEFFVGSLCPITSGRVGGAGNRLDFWIVYDCEILCWTIIRSSLAFIPPSDWIRSK